MTPPLAPAPRRAASPHPQPCATLRIRSAPRAGIAVTSLRSWGAGAFSATRTLRAANGLPSASPALRRLDTPQSARFALRADDGFADIPQSARFAHARRPSTAAATLQGRASRSLRTLRGGASPSASPLAALFDRYGGFAAKVKRLLGLATAVMRAGSDQTRAGERKGERAGDCHAPTANPCAAIGKHNQQSGRKPATFQICLSAVRCARAVQ